MNIEWNGEDLPPVGTLCEISIYTGKWRECYIVAHDNGKAVYRHHNGEYYVYGAAEPGTPYLRPILPIRPTTEERDNMTLELAGILAGHDQHIAVRDIQMAQYLYDIGYRKQVKA